MVARVKLYQMAKVAAEPHLPLHRFVLPMVRKPVGEVARIACDGHERPEGVASSWMLQAL